MGATQGACPSCSTGVSDGGLDGQLEGVPLPGRGRRTGTAASQDGWAGMEDRQRGSGQGADGVERGMSCVVDTPITIWKQRSRRFAPQVMGLLGGG